MKERPILFNDAMVRAILRGKKTQTRRLFEYVTTPKGFGACLDLSRSGYDHDNNQQAFVCPFGSIGDRLWVRETFYKYYPSEGWPAPKALYRADGITLESMDSEGKRQRWTPSIHMPRAFSRITLEINDIKVEQVRDITEEDAWAEGMEALDGSFNEAALFATAKRYDLCVEDSRCIYAHLWDLLYAKRGLGWDANPWVWVVKFERVES